MRPPNPPQVVIEHLTSEQRKQVILLALQVVHELGAERIWAAYERVEFSGIETDEILYSAFWSLLNSEQRSTIKSLSEAAHK